MEDLTGQVLGGYRLLEFIGQGGMSTVYRGVDESTGSAVAVKLLSSYLAQEPRFKVRFAREVKLLKRLSGSNIVPILNYGDEEGFTYIVMPFVAGGTLQDLLSNGGVSLAESAAIIEDISDALRHAHSKGIIHRDVKPSNILLDHEKGALLSDFGFAYVSESSHSLTGSVLIGTPAFMSPEQCRGEEIDQRSDQYSLGAVLFLVTTGQLPYEADTPMGVVVKHIHDPLTPPRALNPYIPDAIEAVVQKAMAKDPDERYPSIEDMNDAYQAALLETLDPETGLPKPESLGPAPQTEVLEIGSKRRKGEATPLWAKGRTSLALAIAIMLALPLVAWALTGRLPGSNDVAAAAQPSATLSADLLATIDALSTENAEALGAMVDADEIQTAVAGTVEAMGLLSGDEAPTATVLATMEGIQLGSTATPTPIALPIGGGAGSGDEGSGSGDPSSTSTWTPAPPATETPGPAPTSTPIPIPSGTPVNSPPPPTATPIPAPTSTPVPPPTSTPVPPTPVPPTDPPDPKVCKDKPHPIFPTCTPGS